MIAPIVDLLASCGVALPRDGSAWRRLLVLNNVGSVPGDGDDLELLRNRGFNMLVVDDDGSATHFCKWRANTSRSRCGGSVVARLSRSPALAAVVPETSVVRTDEIVGEVSRYVHGELLSDLVPDMDAVQMRDALTAILEAWERASAGIVQLEPAVLEGACNVAFIEAATTALDELRDAGCPPRDVEVLASALAAAGVVQSVPQHVDLWPRNIIRAERRWLVLDFEFFARVKVPLYDACHLARTTWDDRPRWRTANAAWIDELLLDSDESMAYKQILANAATRLGLTPTQAGGAFAFYVVDMAARINRRSARDLTRFLADVHRLARWIDGGRQPQDLFLVSQ